MASESSCSISVLSDLFAAIQCHLQGVNVFLATEMLLLLYILSSKLVGEVDRHDAHSLMLGSVLSRARESRGTLSYSTLACAPRKNNAVIA